MENRQIFILECIRQCTFQFCDDVPCKTTTFEETDANGIESTKLKRQFCMGGVKKITTLHLEGKEQKC